MRIQVSFYSGGKGLQRTSISLPETLGPMSIRDVLSNISKNGGKELVGIVSAMDQHDSRRTILIAVNGRSIQSLKGMDTLLHDGDNLSLLPVVAGG